MELVNSANTVSDELNIEKVMETRQFIVQKKLFGASPQIKDLKYPGSSSTLK